jgi:hypothetical protein
LRDRHEATRAAFKLAHLALLSSRFVKWPQVLRGCNVLNRNRSPGDSVGSTREAPTLHLAEIAE